MQSNRPDFKLHTSPSSAKINWSKYKTRYYLHFDTPIDIMHIKDQIQDPKWVSSYAFLPSIHFTITFNKYVTISKDKSLPLHLRKEKKKKKRQIYYAAHKDRFIYKYYGDRLNDAYNYYAKEYGIDETAIAYRNNKPGCNTVDFAYEVFDFLYQQEQAVIMSIDFTKFFDNINHRFLKNNIKTVLGVNELPDDWYKVYKNLTQYTYVNKSKIDNYLKQAYGIKRLKKLIQSKQLKKIMNPADFRVFKKENLYKNKKPYGIPQGSGMSAVCSNVHLIAFDQDIKRWAEQHDALYRRYCDDMILIIPVSGTSSQNISILKDSILSKVLSYEEQGLKIQEEKTEIRLYDGRRIVDEQNKDSSLDYLGFVTDGQVIRLREKSLFKYYYRAYRKADTSRRIALATKRKGPRKELYSIYTHLGFKYKEYGNFTTYANNAHKMMSQLKVESQINKQVKRHWNKIHKRL
ncbi:reverse transcriptase domain-containing protein [Sporosarcina luteola]|uniref:reverse transcriptase domain-containing protein n=1 Tax=Sporosarcina luteola TaxID=582850 RepID=UPI00203C474A|nr:reverse transcriptase domain-containing protein [Sporosarcina luteola]MCM3636859.1 reverse transcriptase domain-containing protein [Sporosarcina luteola]